MKGTDILRGWIERDRERESESENGKINSDSQNGSNKEKT
jgi:hypothetical protein